MFEDKLKELRWKNELLRRSRRRKKLPKMLARLQSRFDTLGAKSIAERLNQEGYTYRGKPTLDFP